MKESVEAVERIVGYEFKKDKRLLEEALTHSSCLNADFNNQRLAFMGDAVLGLAVTKYLFHAYPGIDKGDLTRLRSANVSNEKFAGVAVRHNFYTHLRRSAPDLDDLVSEFTEVVNGEDEEKARGSMDPPKVLADIVESVAAAIYVDLDFDLEEFWKKFRHVLEPIVPLEDLQEEPEPLTESSRDCQKQGKHVKIPVPLHETKSIASVCVDGKFVASGASDNQVIAKVKAAEIVTQCIHDTLVDVIAGIEGSLHIKGAKHKLHNLCAKKKWSKPIYNIKHDEGSSREKKFVSTVQIATINGVLCMTGDEKSRVNDAENSAASLMIRALQESDYV